MSIGVATELKRAGVRLNGRDMLIESTIPMGAGLSSSAALGGRLHAGNARATPAWNHLKWCTSASVRKTISWAFPAALWTSSPLSFGRAGVAIKLDCRSLEYEPVPLPRNVAVVAVNSMVKHELGTSVYTGNASPNAKPCWPPFARSIPRSAVFAMSRPTCWLKDIAGCPIKRARHVVSENMRVQAFANACRAGSIQSMGVYFTQSHRSLQNDYEVSCPEVDFLVDTALAQNGCFGARLTGGGFGGCTVNLVTREAVPDFRTRMRNAYQYSYGIDPSSFVV